MIRALFSVGATCCGDQEVGVLILSEVWEGGKGGAEQRDGVH